eukprot:6464753-Amphidinium_carterae.1
MAERANFNDPLPLSLEVDCPTSCIIPEACPAKVTAAPPHVGDIPVALTPKPVGGAPEEDAPPLHVGGTPKAEGLCLFCNCQQSEAERHGLFPKTLTSENFGAM